MPRPALSAARAARVLSFLASHPGEQYTLSELAREADVNVASMHSVLTVLSDEGFVVREPRRKTYRLGLATIGVGLAALDQHPAVARGRQVASELAETMGRECLFSVLTGTDVLIVAEAGSEERLYMRPRVGQRVPFMPPLGILAAGLLDDPAREAWLDRMGPAAGEAEKDAYREAALAARARGYAVDLETPTRQQIGLLMPQLAQDPRSPRLHAHLAELVNRLGHEEHQLGDPKAGATYAVNGIHAPLFDNQAQFIGGLTVLGFDEPVAADALEEYVQTITSAARTLTLSTGGLPPLGV
jgi:DNA-binding IclR family transcriptional regulator